MTLKLSPSLQRKINNFKKNKRALISLKIFIGLLFLCSFAEFLSNDSPLLVGYKNKLYFPIFKTYSETDFGGDFDIPAEYNDPYIEELIKEDGWILKPINKYSYDTIDYNLDEPAPAKPSKEHWLGTDDQGHDVIAIILYGIRISIIFGISLTFCSSIIGIIIGALQGYFGGILDIIVQRILELWGSIPMLFLLIILNSIFTPSFKLLFFILLAFSWMGLVGVTRIEFLRVRNFEYVKAARALGVKDWKIMFKHILPNALVSAFSMLPFILCGSVSILTSLDFLGFGLPPSYPSLGRLLNQAKGNLHAWWIGLSAFLILAILLSILIFIGEGVRDAFDSRKNK